MSEDNFTSYRGLFVKVLRYGVRSYFAIDYSSCTIFIGKF